MAATYEVREPEHNIRELEETLKRAELANKAQPPIEMALDDLQKTLNELGETVHQLQGRLEPVSRSVERQETTSPDLSEPNSSAVAIKINQQIAQVRAIQYVVAEAIEALEI